LKKLVIEDSLKIDITNRSSILEFHEKPYDECFWCKVDLANMIFKLISDSVALIERDSASIADIPNVWKSLQTDFLEVIAESFLPEEEQLIVSHKILYSLF
jgi:hypothetical protein